MKQRKVLHCEADICPIFVRETHRLRLSISDPRLEASPPDEQGEELRWDWISCYYIRIIYKFSPLYEEERTEAGMWRKLRFYYRLLAVQTHTSNIHKAKIIRQMH